MELLSYKGFHGSAECAISEGVLHGKILHINDLVTYEAETPGQLVKEFEAAVDDYIATCAEIGKTPEKAFSGLFNVRVKPDLHQRAALRAVKDDKTLNAVVSEALEAHLSVAKVVHQHNHTVTLDVSQLRTLTATSTDGEVRHESFGFSTGTATRHH